MPRHQNVLIAANVPTPLSDGPVAACFVQNDGEFPFKLQATLTNVAPSDDEGAVTLVVGKVLAADMPLSSLFPGVGPGPYYLWALSPIAGKAAVSHG